MSIEISVVLPCLNEEETIAACIDKSKKAFAESRVEGEVIVVDNGSTDKSVAIAKDHGAKVIREEEKGYGSALRRGISEAQGQYIVMGDADDTYDFLEVTKFVNSLKAGNDLVMGSRFKGNILPGAMTWSHRYIGNPILSGFLRLFFGGTVSDSHCGLRAFTKEAYKKMGLHTTGMEFASEMVIHALKKKLKISEITITYYPRKGETKLSSLRDAWRHMRFMLLYSPNYLFLMPGVLMFVVGLFLCVRFLFGPIYFAGRNWDIHVMVFSSLLTLLGWQIFNTGLAAKIYAHQIGLEKSPFPKKMLSIFTLERAISIGFIFLTAGLGVCAYILITWIRGGFSFGEVMPGANEWAQLKTALLSLVFIVLGIQTIFSAFLTSMLQIKYK
ncbi:MAG: glycosyltransferase family 2 protein [Elusimicrobia bacterium]|nr:glycosyltransferase family 2 protein [Elusimicrobiota bacterium]